MIVLASLGSAPQPPVQGGAGGARVTTWVWVFTGCVQLDSTAALTCS